MPCGQCHQSEDDQAGEDEVGRVRESEEERRCQEEEPVDSQDGECVKNQAGAHDDAEDPPETVPTGATADL